MEKAMDFHGVFSYRLSWKSENAMKPTRENLSVLARNIAHAEARLQRLEWEIEEIGQPAADALTQRLDALKIEERALKRNLAEVMGMADPKSTRMDQLEALLEYIEQEEIEVEHDADFLHQSPPTSAEFAAQAGNRIVGLCLRAMKRVLGKRHPLGLSVFVNHSHEVLATRYGLVEPDAPSKAGDG